MDVKRGGVGAQKKSPTPDAFSDFGGYTTLDGQRTGSPDQRPLNEQFFTFAAAEDIDSVPQTMLRSFDSLPQETAEKDKPQGRKAGAGFSARSGTGVYTNLDGGLAGVASTEQALFDRARGFRPAEEMSPADAEAVLRRLEVLTMPLGLSPQALYQELQKRVDAFQSYVDARWKDNGGSGKDLGEDIACLARLKGRMTAAEGRVRSGEGAPLVGFVRQGALLQAEPVAVNQEKILAQIDRAQREEMESALLMAQRSLRTKLMALSTGEPGRRAAILAEMQRLGDLFDPQKKKELQAWWDAKTEEPFGGTRTDASDDWSQ